MNITLDANSQGDIRSCLGEETAGKNKGKTCYALLPVTDVASDGENYVSPKRIALNLLSLIVPQADHKVDEYFLRYVETHRRPRVSAPNITADQIAEIIKRFVDNALRFFDVTENISRNIDIVRYFTAMFLRFPHRAEAELSFDNLFNKPNEALKESEISEGRVSSFNYERSRSVPDTWPPTPTAMPRADALVAHSFLLYCDFTDPVTSGTIRESIEYTLDRYSSCRRLKQFGVRFFPKSNAYTDYRIRNSDTFFRGMVKAKNEDDCVGRNVNKVEERIDGKEGKVCERREPTLHHPVTGPTSFCH
ncbi:hypothetical protein V1477_001161 [Vespula maculifrons]|uniref:Uncharacterized protein n=1 Tax=Vespula maculifrons TaxID=7453 RepID=A0ABD2CZR8_VESMC